MAEEILSDSSSEELEAKIRLQVEQENQEKIKHQVEEQVREISTKMQEENKQLVSDAIERIRKQMAPPSQDDIQKLLEQEYEEFTVELKVGGAQRKFVIRELPQAIEKKIFKTIKDVMVPFSTDLAALTMNLLEGDASKKIVQMMNTFEPLLDVMTRVTAIILNPYGEDADITEEWVSKHLSSTRIVKIVTAQAQCNRIRDFFSLLFGATKLTAR